MSILTAPRDKTWIGCIDFGTAMSKMAVVRAVRRDDLRQDDVVPLAIAVREGVTARHPLLLPSMLYIHDDRVVFGQEAENDERRGRIRDRQAFKSLKQYLSTHSFEELDDALPKEIDPTGLYSPRLAIELFLAHILERAGHCANLAGVPWPVPLRIARPAWKPKRAAAGEAALKAMVLRALSLVDLLGPALAAKGGLAHEAVRSAFQAIDVSSADESDVFMHDARQRASVLEASAAAAGAIDDRGRRVVVVADIGGGTSDFGAFMTGLPGRSVLAEISGSANVLRKAGDHLDMLLTGVLLDKLDLVPGDPAARGAQNEMRRRQREYKELLFGTGRLQARVGDDVIDITAEEFLASSGVEKLGQQLRDTFLLTLAVAVECAREHPQPTSRRRTEVEILFTGGGHSLPIVRDLAEGLPDKWSYRIVDPDFRESQDDTFRQVSRQLAVAVGGAMRDLPKMTAPIRVRMG